MASVAQKSELPLIVIVGPTASGKTELAIRIAKEFGGEIISADSRAVYKGLSIGTAKPSKDEQQGVPHWGIDVARPDERFTAADFKEYAVQKIAEIRARGHIPLLVGGTGLYIDAVVYDFQFPQIDNVIEVRSRFMKRTNEELIEYCNKNNIKLPYNFHNKRHLVSQILRKGEVQKSGYAPRDNTVIVGIATEKSTLDERIKLRAKQIFASGVIDEAVAVAAKYGWDNEAMSGNIYPLIKQYLEGRLTKSELQERFAIKDRQLAKRQVTWFKRNEHITWLSLEDAHTYIARYLENVNNL